MTRGSPALSFGEGKSEKKGGKEKEERNEEKMRKEKERLVVQKGRSLGSAQLQLM